MTKLLRYRQKVGNYETVFYLTEAAATRRGLTSKDRVKGPVGEKSAPVPESDKGAVPESDKGAVPESDKGAVPESDKGAPRSRRR